MVARWKVAGLAAVFVVAAVSAADGAKKKKKPVVVRFPNQSGALGTLAPKKKLDTSGPFFQSLGTNDRACITCHEPEAGWSITPALAQERFAATAGFHPLFRPHDGANSPFADVSTPTARQLAYSNLLQRGVIRIGLPIPANAEFTLEAVDDPYGFASAAELSLFRRPLPATNLRFLTDVMWDGRESHPGQSLEENLASQAMNATLGHAQGAGPLEPATLDAIVQFELANVTAQERDQDAKSLHAAKGRGGPKLLAKQPFTPGSNDPFSIGGTFDPEVFTLFKKWGRIRGKSRAARGRAAIARGEQLFNTRVFNIRETPGVNDVLNQPIVPATCGTCHNAQNVGGHTLSRFMNIGVGTVILNRTPQEPLYTLRNLATNEVVQTPDPGRALITGKWEDIGRFKVPSLRGLAARPPYFHSGTAATLHDVVDFYDRRYGIGLRPDEMDDLVAFLRAL